MGMTHLKDQSGICTYISHIFLDCIPICVSVHSHIVINIFHLIGKGNKQNLI